MSLPSLRRSKAFAKSQLGAGTQLPVEGTVFLSVKNSDKEDLIPIARDLQDMGFKLVATGGTHKFLSENGLQVERINKVLEGQPHIVDALINGDIQLVINTTMKSAQAVADATSVAYTVVCVIPASAERFSPSANTAVALSVPTPKYLR